MENYKHNQLKGKSFKEIQILFNNTMKWIEAFVPMDTELVKGSEKAEKGSEKKTAEAKPKAITTAATTVTVASTRPKAKGIVMQETSERPTPTPIDSSQQSSKAKEKGKAKMIKPEKPLKRKEHNMIDEEVAKNLEA
nr:hypothetical protein [Tanacetum cinerariifolium]